MSVAMIYEDLKERFGDVVPAFELKEQAAQVEEIRALKKEKGAVILAHNYMEPVLFHAVADIRGDSLELSRKAAETDARVIVYCGVRFMAETAKILNPDRTVLLPSEKGGCSLAEGITAEQLRELKKMYPGAPVVTYINTYADVKAETDICCTSSNAAAVVNSLNADLVICVPDRYLASNIARETGRRIVFPELGVMPEGTPGVDYGMVGWNALCEVHEQFTVEDVAAVRKQFSDAVVLAHPECSPEVVAVADYSSSTSAMARYIQEAESGRFLLLTECAMGDNIAAANPDKEMIRMCSIRCPHMNEVKLQEVIDALRYNQHPVEVDEELRIRAKRSIDRMLEIRPSAPVRPTHA